MNRIIAFGLQALLKHDGYLLSEDVNERSITHRLGMYYQSFFPNWDVDCEFNKNSGDPKVIHINPRLFLDKMAKFLETDNNSESNQQLVLLLREEKISEPDIAYLRRELKNPENLIYKEELDILIFVLKSRQNGKLIKTIYPDIIVHQRGTKNNYIVIEAKKSTNKDSVERAYDLVKLYTLVSDKDYLYKRGFFIDIPTGIDFSKTKRFIFKNLRLEKKVCMVKGV